MFILNSMFYGLMEYYVSIHMETTSLKLPYSSSHHVHVSMYEHVHVPYVLVHVQRTQSRLALPARGCSGKWGPVRRGPGPVRTYSSNGFELV